MVDAINSQERVYSSDKKIYSGMEVKEAANSLEAIRIFNYADMNDNGKIDEVELSRYDGPIVQYDENMENPKLKDKKDLTTVKYELYTSLKIEDVPKEFREEFFYTDIDKNGELSLAEMTRKQIKVETGFDVEVSENMTKEDMKRLITEKRIEKDINDIREIIEKGNRSSIEIGLTAVGESVVGAGIGGAIGTVAITDLIGGSAIAGGLIGAALGCATLGALGLYGFEERRECRLDAVDMMENLEQKYKNSPDVLAQLEQLKKDNKWLDRYGLF